jgi:hypothetical protein
MIKEFCDKCGEERGAVVNFHEVGIGILNAQKKYWVVCQNCADKIEKLFSKDYPTCEVHIDTKLIDNCLYCGAPQCCPKCCALEDDIITGEVPYVFQEEINKLKSENSLLRKKVEVATQWIGELADHSTIKFIRESSQETLAQIKEIV